MSHTEQSPSLQDDFRTVLQEAVFQAVQELLRGTRSESQALQIPGTDTYIFAGPRANIADFILREIAEPASFVRLPAMGSPEDAALMESMKFVVRPLEWAPGVADRIDQLLADAEHQNLYGGSEDGEGALQPGNVDWVDLRANVSDILAAQAEQPQPAGAAKGGEDNSAEPLASQSQAAQPTVDTPKFRELIEAHDRAIDGKEMDEAYDAIVAYVAHLAGQSQAKPAECSGTPSSCPENEGHGCECGYGAPEAGQSQATMQAEPEGWKKLHSSDVIDWRRKLDVVLDNGVYEYDRYHSQIDWTAVRDWRYAAPVAKEATDPEAPAILEAISWHAGERDDLTLEEAVEAFRNGYKKVRQREDRAMLLQLIALMASAPASVAKEAPAVPEGCALVPIVPTKEMCAAAVKAAAEFRYNSAGMQGFTHADAYSAMLAAAPQAPATQEAEIGSVQQVNADPELSLYVAYGDDDAVDLFAKAMKAKMAASRAKGRGGWHDPDDCPTERLQVMLIDHLSKGDPVDIGNFAMMLWNRGERVAAPATQQAAKTVAWIDEFGNVWPLGAYSPTGKSNYHDAHKRGWKPLHLAPTTSTVSAPAAADDERDAVDPNVFFDALSDYNDSPMSVSDGQQFFDKINQAAPSSTVSALDEIRNAARAVVNDALEEMRDRVHPCDQNNDEAVARQIPPLMQNLARALRTVSASDVPEAAVGEVIEEVVPCSGITARGFKFFDGRAKPGDKLYLGTQAAPEEVRNQALETLLNHVIDDFREMNPSNYTHDEACDLNNWGIEAVGLAQDVRALLTPGGAA